VLSAAQTLAAPPVPQPNAYSLEQRHFNGQPDDPNPVARIYVSGQKYRTEVYVDGKLRSITISRPDRDVVYSISAADNEYSEQSFEELRSRGFSARGHFSLEEFEDKAKQGKLVLTRVGSETVLGQACVKYSISQGQGVLLSDFWVATPSGFPVRYRLSGSRIEWSTPRLGPQPDKLFELPPGVRKRP
jgi:hypothetical protein